MTRAYIILVYLVVVLSCSTGKQPFELNSGLHISDVLVLTTNDGNYHPFKGHVVVEGEEIIYVGEEEPDIQGEYQKIDGTGKYLIPGLIDSHVHITEVQGMLYPQQEQYPGLADEFRKQMPRSYLYFGYTTLINLGGVSEAQVDFFNEQPVKPNLYHTGRSGASVANGYPMNFSPEDIRFELSPNFLFIESEADRIPDKYDPADHSPEAVVKRIKAAGGIAVKSYYEPGFRGMAKLPVPTKEMMIDLRQNAQANGLVLTVHGNSLDAHAFLSEIGVDVIAHGLWNWGRYRNVPKDSLPHEIKEVLDLQIRKQIAYTPTLTVIEGEKVLADPEFLDHPQLRKVVPPKLLAWYKTAEGQWFAKELFENYTSEEVERIYGLIQAHGQLALKYLSDNGGLILFGTDTPSAPTYGNQPGYNGYWEMKLMQESGVPLNTILASATLNNAKVFQLDDLIGSIEVGKQANLLLLTKNPLEEIEAYDHIEKVFLKGRVIERKELSVR